MMSSQSLYHHNPLGGADHIRILELQPLNATQKEESLSCVLKDVSLSINPDYEAVSYTWGLPVFPKLLNCGNGEIGITNNLYLALKRFQLQDQPRSLWVDAVCINQESDAEKSVQIPLMLKVYSQASTVLVWLGEPPAGCEGSISFLHGLVGQTMYRPRDPDSLITHQISRPSFNDDNVDGILRMIENVVIEVNRQSAHRSYLEKIREPTYTTEWGALETFFELPWFSRRWVVQEVAFAGKSTLFCGRDSIDWEDFVAALGIVEHIDQKSGTSCLNSYMNVHATLIAWREVRNTSGIPIRSLMQTFSALWYFDCSDDRDRIFSVLSFIDLYYGDKKKNHFRPNYARSTGEIYEDFARYCLEILGDLDILSFCQKRPLEMFGLSDLDLPSWVPDWRPTGLTESLTESLLRGSFKLNKNAECQFSAGTARQAHVSFSSIKTLTVRGVKFDTVAAVCHSGTDWDQIPQPGPKYAAFWSERYYTRSDQFSKFLLEHAWYDRPYPTGEHISKVVARTLVLDNQTYPSRQILGSQTDADILCSLLSDWIQRCLWTGTVPLKVTPTGFLPTSPEQRAGLFHFAFGTVSEGRCLFVTKNGYIGLGPNCLTEDDAVCILFGAHTPLILHPCENNSYVLLETSYVHGIMYGEIFDMNISGLEEDFHII